jgi:catechol 2,3-dioxygenase-like lactoylglutathione lyase family enzyme
VNLDHVALEETDIESAVALHVDVLGFELLRWGRHVATGRRIAMLADPAGGKVELIEVEVVTGELAHVAYRTGEPADLDAAHVALLHAGCTELNPPFRLGPAKARTSFVRDAAGRRVQLIAYDPDSPDLRKP